ncbi:hypothetical protein B4144_3033 [Bacillus atrophaeus]|nr:hypothetical protein B4144_3033 [Bacillus atrophaeus]
MENKTELSKKRNFLKNNLKMPLKNETFSYICTYYVMTANKRTVFKMFGSDF